MIIDNAKQAGVPIEYLSKHDLNVLTNNSVHQVLIIINQAESFVSLPHYPHRLTNPCL